MAELEDIVEIIEKEAGFEVYHHACGRKDLNDWTPEDGNNYTRAIHNIRNPHWMEPISTHEVKNAIGGTAGQGTDFDVVAYGLLPAAEEYAAQIRFTKADYKSAIEIAFKTPETNKETACESSQELSQVVNTNNKDNAYFVRLTIRAHVSDSGNRFASYPVLTIIGDRKLSLDIVEYLENNPQDYMKFINLVLPQDKFPRVNKGILTEAKPAKSIVFLDADKIDKTRETEGWNGRLKDWVYEEYGKKIEVR